MPAGQILKDEKVSIIDLLCFRVGAFQAPNSKLYANFKSHFRFVIKHLPFKLKQQLRPRRLAEKEKKLDYLTSESGKTKNLRIEICSEKINTLLAQRQICAADIHCLDTSSKQCLKTLCLKTCLYNTVHSNPAPQLLDDLTIADSPLQIEQPWPIN